MQEKATRITGRGGELTGDHPPSPLHATLTASPAHLISSPGANIASLDRNYVNCLKMLLPDFIPAVHVVSPSLYRTPYWPQATPPLLSPHC